MKSDQPNVGARVSVPSRPRIRGKYFGHINLVEGGTVHFVEVDGDLLPCKIVKALPADCL